MSDDLEATWEAVEASYRKAFTEHLEATRAAFFRAHQPQKKSELPIVRLRLLYFDQDGNLPLALYEYEMIGTREELVRLIEAQHKQLVESPQYRKNQNAIFNRLKDEFGLRDKDILDLLIPTATADERDLVYKRLKQDRGRKKRARRATKS